MRSRSLVVVALLGALVGASACRSAGDPNRKTWYPPQAHEALQVGATVRASYYPMICPSTSDYYVARRDGSFVKTFDQLRPVLRPIDTPERALAYQKLLRKIQIERDETLTALQWTTPLRFDEGDEPSYAAYVAADAARWGVGKEPAIEARGDVVVITRPSYRMVETIDENGKAWVLGEGVVELVRESIHRDGRYERDVVRVLEEGKAAEVYQPAPLL